MIRLTPVVRNLLIINVVVFAMQSLLSNIDVTSIFSLWKVGSNNFAPYQFFSYMFAHGDFSHILFNMMGLVFLGPLLERFWGSNKFLAFYMITGIGAGILYSGIEYFRMNQLERQAEYYVLDPSPDHFNEFVDNNSGYFNAQVYDFIDEFSNNPDNVAYISKSKEIAMDVYKNTFNLGSMLGASGAIYGILMAFGLLFPNTELMLLFPPIPVKAKYLVLVLGGIALYSGLSRNPGDNVAHFAHLGGMVFAFIMIQIWKKGRDQFY